MVPLYLIFSRPTPWLMVAGLVFALAGVLIRAWAARAIRKNSVLTTHGPYAFTRNPLYLGSFLIGIGFGIASGVPWILALFLVFFVLVYGRTMRREERRLAALFGDAFDRYATAVPRFLPRPAAWSDVTGETSPAWRDTSLGESRAGARAFVESRPLPAPEARADKAPQPRMRRYLSTREYEVLLGIAVMYLALLIKLLL